MSFRAGADDYQRPRPMGEVIREAEVVEAPMKPLEEVGGRVDDMRRLCLGAASIAHREQMPEIHRDLMELREHVERVELKLTGLVAR